MVGRTKMYQSSTEVRRVHLPLPLALCFHFNKLMIQISGISVLGFPSPFFFHFIFYFLSFLSFDGPKLKHTL